MRWSIVIMTTLASFVIGNDTEVRRHPKSDAIIEKYIDLSMELSTILNESGIPEKDIHKLAQRMISNEDNEDKVQKILDQFMESLDEEKQKTFGLKYFDKIKIDYITKKTHRVLGFYLTKDQIRRLRDVLQQNYEAGASRPEIVHALVEELSKDIKREKAVHAIERTMKDLKIFVKKNPGWVEKVEKMFHKLVHDEM